jgi:hypothetical protein
MDDHMASLKIARIALTFYRRWMAKHEPATTYPYGIDAERILRNALEEQSIAHADANAEIQ